MNVEQSKLEETADEIIDSLPSEADVEESFVRDKLSELVGEYSVPVEEARRSVINSVTNNTDVDPSDMGGGGSEEVLVNNVEVDGVWVTLEVTIDELWDPNHESIAQVGLMGDESGSNKFTAFGDVDQFGFEEGESYRIESAVTDEYNGDVSIKLNDSSEITQLDESVEIGDETETVSGMLVNIYSDSGLIKRCPEDDCTYVLVNGRCKEHGGVDGHEFDFRIKGTLDDGQDTSDVIFNRETAEQLAGISLEEAKKIAKEELDTEKVLEHFEDDIVGRYYTVTAIPMYGSMMVDDFRRETETPSINDLLVRARSI